MLKNLKIAIAQINPILGDLTHNLKLVEAALVRCKDADLVVFPELVICGYPPEDLVLSHSFVTKCMAMTKEFIANHKTGPAYVFTTPWREGEKTYNAALFVENGAIKSVIYKNNLPNYGVFDEKRVFSSGPLPEPVLFKGHKLGVAICEDIWFPETCAHLKQRGAEIILSPNGSPYSTQKRGMRRDVALARVRETGLPLVYVNQIGGQDDLVYDGGSFAMDGAGQIVFQAPWCEAYVGSIAPLPFSHRKEGEAEVYEVLKLALKDYVAKNNFPGVIIGMSGGIDSALSAAIACDALGPENVRCVMLPSPFTSAESFEDAENCCGALGCSYEIIGIEKTMRAFEEAIPNLAGLAYENMQARARGLILMSLSNQTGRMVLTTGNKSEMAVGYATLYGDMCGGFNVLKDVYKTLVYRLAAYRNTLSPVIPDRIITKAPTAELRPGQTDQDSLPPYDVLDEILEGLIERRESPDEVLVRTGHDLPLVTRIQGLLGRAEYKRRQSAPGPKITPMAFGRDRRMPITNGYKS